MSYTLEVGGIEQEVETFVATTGLRQGTDERLRNAVSFSGADFATGMYDYALTLTGNFNTSRMSSISNGRVMVSNEMDSPFGAGWRLDGLMALAFNEDQSVTLVMPASRSITYRRSLIDDSLVTPDADFSTLQNNPDGSYTHTTKQGIKTHFDAQGRQTAVEDRNGNVTGYLYDGSGRLTTLTDPVGLATTLAYGSHGNLETVTDPANRTTAFEYDAAGNLIKVIYPDGSFVAHTYDDRHLMQTRADERGNTFQYEYDGFGKMIGAILPDESTPQSANRNSVGLVDTAGGNGTETEPVDPGFSIDAAARFADHRGNLSERKLDGNSQPLKLVDEVGRVTRIVRDADSNPIIEVRPIGSRVDRTFDRFGNVLTETEAFNGATTQFAYDPFSLVTSITNPNNHTATINRDAEGNPTSIVNELGHTITTEYDDRGLVTRMLSPNGLETTFTYNDQGLLETQTETPPQGSTGNVRVTEFSYLPTGLVQQMITPDGITLTFAYDARSRVTSIADNLNQSIAFTYDESGNVIQTDTANSDGTLALTVASVFDGRNRLTETRAPHSATEESITQRLLDNNGNLVGFTDPNAGTSSNGYDTVDRLIENIHRLDGVSSFEYDELDRIIRVDAPNGATTTFTYDLLGRRLTESSPDRGTVQFTYDLANNLTSVTDGRDITATLTYDELERVSTKTYPNTIPGKDEDVIYTYDDCPFGVGQLCVRTDESGTYAFEYDAFGNQTRMSFTELSGIIYDTSYVYDDGDNLIQTTMPSGRVVDYSRDSGRRVQAIDTTINELPRTLVSGIQYRADNQVTQSTFGNGLIDERTYDLQGRLTHQVLKDAVDSIVDERTYTYDKNGNILDIDTNFEDNAYQYDALDRLIEDGIDQQSPLTYTYDLNDNRLTGVPVDSSTEELSDYLANSNRLRLTDAVDRTDTPLSTLPERELVYNDAGRLYQLIEDGELKASYVYNDDGLRTRKIIHDQAGGQDIVIVYHYGQSRNLITETDESGNLIRDYIWRSALRPIVQIDNDGGSETLTYLHTDHLFTNRLATDESQTIVWRWEGEAFGQTLPEELAGISVNLRFPGQYFDDETGLHYNKQRYYDPQVGRFITSDPIGLVAGLNSYNYVLNNPINSIDPTGEINIGTILLATAIIVGTIKLIDFINTLNEASEASDAARENRKKTDKEIDKMLEGKPADVDAADQAFRDSVQDLLNKSGELGVDAKELESGVLGRLQGKTKPFIVCP